jgi:hypothetical protein
VIRVRNWNDVSFGLFLALIGVAGLAVTSELRPGTAMRMGPGYLPSWLSWACIGLGAIILAKGFAKAGEAPEGWSLRPLVMISAAVTAFVLVERIGLFAAVVAVTLIGSAGDPETKWGQSLALAALLAFMCALVFVKALGLAFPLWPSFLAF